MKRIALLMLLLGCGPLAAHDTWLEAGRGRAIAQLHLTSGTAFPVIDYAIKPERVARAWGRTAKGEIEMPRPVRGRHALVFQRGVDAGSFAVQLAPKTLELEADKVAHYFDEIHAGEVLRQRWRDTPEPRRWREEYVKHSKTLAARGAACAAHFGDVLGLGLEIVPEVDPCLLPAGSTLTVKLLDRGAPKPGLMLALVAAGGREVAALATDAEGRAGFTLPRRGRWLLRATDLRPAHETALGWQSDFTTYTFAND